MNDPHRLSRVIWMFVGLGVLGLMVVAIIVGLGSLMSFVLGLAAV